MCDFKAFASFVWFSFVFFLGASSRLRQQYNIHYLFGSINRRRIIFVHMISIDLFLLWLCCFFFLFVCCATSFYSGQGGGRRRKLYEAPKNAHIRWPMFNVHISYRSTAARLNKKFLNLNNSVYFLSRESIYQESAKKMKQAEQKKKSEKSGQSHHGKKGLNRVFVCARNFRHKTNKGDLPHSLRSSHSILVDFNIYFSPCHFWN